MQPIQCKKQRFCKELVNNGKINKDEIEKCYSLSTLSSANVRRTCLELFGENKILLEEVNATYFQARGSEFNRELALNRFANERLTISELRQCNKTTTPGTSGTGSKNRTACIESSTGGSQGDKENRKQKLAQRAKALPLPKNSQKSPPSIAKTSSKPQESPTKNQESLDSSDSSLSSSSQNDTLTQPSTAIAKAPSASQKPPTRTQESIDSFSSSLSLPAPAPLKTSSSVSKSPSPSNSQSSLQASSSVTQNQDESFSLNKPQVSPVDRLASSIDEQKPIAKSESLEVAKVTIDGEVSITALSSPCLCRPSPVNYPITCFDDDKQSAVDGIAKVGLYLCPKTDNVTILDHRTGRPTNTIKHNDGQRFRMDCSGPNEEIVYIDNEKFNCCTSYLNSFSYEKFLCSSLVSLFTPRERILSFGTGRVFRLGSEKFFVQVVPKNKNE